MSIISYLTSPYIVIFEKWIISIDLSLLIWYIYCWILMGHWTWLKLYGGSLYVFILFWNSLYKYFFRLAYTCYTHVITCLGSISLCSLIWLSFRHFWLSERLLYKVARYWGRNILILFEYFDVQTFLVPWTFLIEFGRMLW